LELPEEKLQGKTRQASSKTQRNNPFSSAAFRFFPAFRMSSKAQRNNPFSSTALFGPPRRETVADRARGALRASARTDTSSDDGAHSEANRKATSKKAAKKPRKVGGKLGVGLFINESRGGVVVDDSFDKESDDETIADRDRAALQTLADDRNLRGTTAFRLRQAATAAEAHPGWLGTGPHYTAWLNALGRTPSSPEAALGSSAPELAYLAMMNGEQELPVLHNVHR